MAFETENIEFKRQFTDEIYKEVIAFANTDGGVIYVGIDNDGNAKGLENVDSEFAKITNGVFVRQGTSSVPASYEQIRQLIKDNDGDIFEEMRSIHQDLTFDAASVSFKKYGVDFGTEKYRTLGITQASSQFTNLAMLISDQCKHTIKVAVFGDDANTVFKDNREFQGSIFRQLEETFTYLQLCNKTVATFKGLERIENQDYPEEAIREALLNAIVHRDYSFSGSIIINVNDNEMEFVSIGGLLPGLSPGDIRSGISQPRNKNLAEIFHRLHLIESYGTGIRKIYHLYRQCSLQPRIEVTANTFKMVLPNMNVSDKRQEKPSLVITSQMKKVLAYISAHGQVTDEEISSLLNIKKTRTFNLVTQMREMDLLVVSGRGKDKRYSLK